MEEFVSPFYEFIDNGYDVTIASPRADNLLWIQRVIWKSGKPNLQQRFQKDKSAQEKLANTLVLSQVSASDYDTLFLPGGHGPMWDLSVDINLKKFS